MTVRLMQWNCMYLENPGKIAEYIKAINPDIVCLQELTSGYDEQWGDTGELIANYLGYDYYCKYGLMLLPDGGQTAMGVGILSRYPLHDKRGLQIEVRKTEEGRIMSNDRYYIQATVALPEGQVLKVGTLHLPFHPTFETSAHVRDMIKHVLNFLPQAGEFVLAGDFNKPPQSEVAKLFRQSGLWHAGPALRYPTWTTKPFAVGDWSYDELRWRLDYILCRGNLKRRKPHVLATTLSDHLPLLVELEVGGR
jgi:endonuclease/exonuclease/phosphatase family metal-dependent hydrolase